MSADAPDSPVLPSLTLCPGSREDAAILVPLIRAAFAEYDDWLDPPSSASRESEENILRKMAKARVFIARVGEVPVGCVFFEEQEDATYLFRLAVLPEYRKQGIGQRLLTAVETETVAHPHLHTVRLATHIALEQNRAYYERLGYRITAYKCHPGYTEPTYVEMEKGLP